MSRDGSLELASGELRVGPSEVGGGAHAARTTAATMTVGRKSLRKVSCLYGAPGLTTLIDSTAQERQSVSVGNVFLGFLAEVFPLQE